MKSDLALDRVILQITMRNLDTAFGDQSVSLDRKRWVVVVGTYLVVCFLFSLRGNDGFMVELGGVMKHIYDGKGDLEDHPHVVVSLLGRFKNEGGERWNLMLVASEIASGFKPRM